MFKKIISNLPFSPALVGQLGFYAKRLRREKTTRKLTLIFIALTMVVQSLAVFQPSMSANASSPNDFVNGGIGQSLDNFLNPYDANTKNLRDIINYIGITRDEITSTQFTTFQSTGKLSWGLTALYSYDRGERPYNITNSNGEQVTTAYSRPTELGYGTNKQITGWVGHSEKIGWFAIMQACGNIATETAPPPPVPPKCLVNSKLLASDENCRTCPGNVTLWVSDKACVPNIIKSKTATNMSQGSVDASTVTAASGDQISYTITIKNTGLNSTSSKLEDNISDVLEYSSLIDNNGNNGGGSLDKSTGILSWPDVTLKPDDTQTRTFVVRLLDTLPATAQGASNPLSYDCVMTNTFGNSIDIKVDCPTPKIIEQVTTELPKTGPTENIIFASVILAFAAYFFARSRQLEKEIRIIRKNINTGTI